MANRKRNQTISIRLTTEEKKEIVAKAKQAQMTLTDYLIECSSNTDITVTDLSEVLDEIRISNEKDYQPSVAAAINRRTSFSIKDGKLVTQHQYSIDRKNYIVNSIFDMNSKLSITDGVKHLIDTELEKAS